MRAASCATPEWVSRQFSRPPSAEFRPGHVWLIGAGPGDPGLLTLHALAGIEQAIALDPQYADAHLNRGNLCGHLKRYEEAAKSFEHALRLKPGLGDAWLGYGNVLLHLDRGEEALAAYERALSLNPDSTAAWLGRGNAFADLKRYGEAFAAYDRALSLRPTWRKRGSAEGMSCSISGAMTKPSLPMTKHFRSHLSWRKPGSVVAMR